MPDLVSARRLSQAAASERCPRLGCALVTFVGMALCWGRGLRLSGHDEQTPDRGGTDSHACDTGSIQSPPHEDGVGAASASPAAGGARQGPLRDRGGTQERAGVSAYFYMCCRNCNPLDLVCTTLMCA